MNSKSNYRDVFKSYEKIEIGASKMTEFILYRHEKKSPPKLHYVLILDQAGRDLKFRMMGGVHMLPNFWSRTGKTEEWCTYDA